MKGSVSFPDIFSLSSGLFRKGGGGSEDLLIVSCMFRRGARIEEHQP